MSHPYDHARADHRERAHKMIGRTGNKMARGGGAHPDKKEDEALIREAMNEHDSQQHEGKKTRLKFKAGGAVEGEHAKHHLGRRARGGPTGKGGKHVTNVIVSPQGGGQGGGGMRPPMAPPQAMAAPPPRPAAPPPPPPQQGGMPPGGGAPPMGMRPPGAMKRGGGVKHKRARGGEADCDEEDGRDGEREERARGGRTQKVQEVGVPSESLMQANRGGHIRKRDVGGSTGVPTNPTQMSAQQVQQVAQIRKQQAMAKQAQMAQQQGQGGMRPGMQPPMGAAQAARMQGAPPMQKRGGEVRVKEHVRRARGGHVEMEAGAGGGQGRIEKTHEYGSGRGFKPKEKPLHA
jgi:hypothetical protein